MTNADRVRAGAPRRSMAASSARQFITVASMPMVSPVGRETPREDTSTPRTNIAAADDDGDLGTQLPGRDQVAGDPVDGWLVDAGCVRAGEIFAGKLDHHATIDRLSHC